MHVVKNDTQVYYFQGILLIWVLFNIETQTKIEEQINRKSVKKVAHFKAQTIFKQPVNFL